MTEKQLPEIAESQSIGDSDAVVDNAIDPAMEKQVVRKIDRVVLPLMAVVYFFQCKPLTAHPEMELLLQDWRADVCTL